MLTKCNPARIDNVENLAHLVSLTAHPICPQVVRSRRAAGTLSRRNARLSRCRSRAYRLKAPCSAVRVKDLFYTIQVP